MFATCALPFKASTILHLLRESEVMEMKCQVRSELRCEQKGECKTASETMMFSTVNGISGLNNMESIAKFPAYTPAERIKDSRMNAKASVQILETQIIRTRAFL